MTTQVVDAIRQAKAAGTFPSYSHHAAAAPSAALEADDAAGDGFSARLQASAAGALAGSAAVVAATSRAAPATRAGGAAAATVFAGAAAGAVAGGLMVGAGDEDFETDTDVERDMAAAADQASGHALQLLLGLRGTCGTWQGVCAQVQVAALAGVCVSSMQPAAYPALPFAPLPGV